MIHAERATSTTERALWRLILDRVSAAAAVLVLVVFSAPGVARAKAVDIQSLSVPINDSMYIMFKAD